MLKQLLDEKPFKYGFYSQLETVPYLVEKEHFDVFVYGFGRNGRIIKKWLKQTYNVDTAFFVDKQPVQKRYEDISVMDLAECKQYLHEHKDKGHIAIVSVAKYETSSAVKEDVLNYLNGCEVGLVIDGTRIVKPYKEGWEPEYFEENIGEFAKSYNVLADEVSKNTFYEYLKAWMTGARYSGRTYPEEYKYFGGGENRCAGEKCLFNVSEEEIFLNIGACRGDTIIQFLKYTDNFNKIIAVEADESIFAELQNVIECLNKEVQNRIHLERCFLGVGENTIDELWRNEKISLINMDIEGAELSVLQTGIETIRKNRPVLAICAYHKRDDLIKIPQFITDNFDDYIIVLRKYPSAFFGALDGVHQLNELVLYAIPKERYIAECGK